MVMFYFSGTGNSKYISDLFCQKTKGRSLSIEENLNFNELIEINDVIGFCYPIYCSRIPRIMREFAHKYVGELKGKKVINFCTQASFSGDGARAFIDLLPKKHVEVIYAEHFLMPNNICNFALFPKVTDKKIAKAVKKAEQRVEKVFKDVEKGIIRRRGFNLFSRILGLPQAVLLPIMEKSGQKNVKVAKSCNRCMLCTTICPMDNLTCEEGEIIHQKNCTLCYRCVNKCPQKAITVFVHSRVKNQYNGVDK